MSAGFSVRVCDIFGMSYRSNERTMPQTEFDLTPQFRQFYDEYLPPRQEFGQEVLPRLVAQRVYNPATTRLVTVGSADSADDEFQSMFYSGVERVEIALFALPAPVNQVVGVFIVDLSEGSVGSDGRIGHLREAMVRDQVWIDDRSVLAVAESLAETIGAGLVDESRRRPMRAELSPTPFVRGRHVLVFVHPQGPGSSATMPQGLDDAATRLVVGAQRSDQEEFAKVYRPANLNDGRRYAALSHRASLLYGQADRVDSSVLLITAQTVGTAVWFQKIWRRVLDLAEDFQESKRWRTGGREARLWLADLADEMADLEIDLTVVVQTAVDLGFGDRKSLVSNFHSKLRKAMEFTKSIDAVARTIQAVNSSISSELTALVSQERGADERRQRLATIIPLVLTSFLAPLTIVLGYFGISTDDVLTTDTMFNLHRFWPVYTVAGALLILQFVGAVILTMAYRGRVDRRSRRPR